MREVAKSKIDVICIGLRNGKAWRDKDKRLEKDSHNKKGKKNFSKNSIEEKKKIEILRLQENLGKTTKGESDLEG